MYIAKIAVDIIVLEHILQGVRTKFQCTAWTRLSHIRGEILRVIIHLLCKYFTGWEEKLSLHQIYNISFVHCIKSGMKHRHIMLGTYISRIITINKLWQYKMMMSGQSSSILQGLNICRSLCNLCLAEFQILYIDIFIRFSILQKENLKPDCCDATF